MVRMTYAGAQLMMKSIVLKHSCTPASHTLTERSNFSKNGLAMPNFES